MSASLGIANLLSSSPSSCSHTTAYSLFHFSPFCLQKTTLKHDPARLKWATHKEGKHEKAILGFFCLFKKKPISFFFCHHTGFRTGCSYPQLSRPPSCTESLWHDSMESVSWRGKAKRPISLGNRSITHHSPSFSQRKRKVTSRWFIQNLIS